MQFRAFRELFPHCKMIVLKANLQKFGGYIHISKIAPYVLQIINVQVNRSFVCLCFFRKAGRFVWRKQSPLGAELASWTHQENIFWKRWITMILLTFEINAQSYVTALISYFSRSIWADTTVQSHVRLARCCICLGKTTDPPCRVAGTCFFAIISIFCFIRHTNFYVITCWVIIIRPRPQKILDVFFFSLSNWRPPE